jgi:hypothetical protein
MPAPRREGLEILRFKGRVVDRRPAEQPEFLCTRVVVGSARAAAEVVALRELLTQARTPDEGVIEQVVEVLPTCQRQRSALEEVEVRSQIRIHAVGPDRLVRHAVLRRAELSCDVTDCAPTTISKLLAEADLAAGVAAVFLVSGLELRTLRRSPCSAYPYRKR